MALLLMFAIRGLATNSSLLAIYLPFVPWYCREKKKEKWWSTPENKYPISILGRGKLINLSSQPISQPTGVMWSRFSPMLVWKKENFWNRQGLRVEVLIYIYKEMSVCLSVYLSVCLSICMFVPLFWPNLRVNFSETCHDDRFCSNLKHGLKKSGKLLPW